MTPSHVHLAGRGLDPEQAFALADEVVAEAHGGPLDVVGRYVVPVPDGLPTRDFQALHVDFGLPLAPQRPRDLARYTALHVPPDAGPVSAVTRLVPLEALLRQRGWPGPAELVERFERYGRSHGAWDDTYVEGILARVVEAAGSDSPLLPPVTSPGFLCGTEFGSAADEARFLAALGLDVAAVAVDVRLAPGDLLVFDNHAFAHGRLGRRLPGELHQRFYGTLATPVAEQERVRDRMVGWFGSTGSVADRVEGRARTA